MNQNKFLTIIHYNGKIVRTDAGIVFEAENTTKMRFEKEITLRQLKGKISQKIGRDIHGLRYRWLTCENPVTYCAINLEDDDDVAMMIAEHESVGIRYIELFAEISDVPNPSRTFIGESSQINYVTETELPGGSFLAMLSGGTANEFNPVDTSTDNVNNLRGRWGEALDDSSEDEDIDDDDLFPDDVGNSPNYGVGEFVAPAGDITCYEPPTHMVSLDFDAMRAAEFPDVSRLTYTGSDDLSNGIQFEDNDQATLAVKEYSIKNHVDYVVVESSQKTFLAKCVKYGQECNWKIRITKRKRSNMWEVSKYSEDHTCLRSSIAQDHRKLDTSVISHHVKNLVEINPRVPVSTIQATIAQQFQYQIKYKKGWCAREKALDSVYGDYDKSYNELPALLLAMTHFIPGTIVRYQTKDAYDQQGQVHQDYKFFHRLFWAFKPCIDGFPYCKRMIQVDGTWLYGRYSHILLIAVAQDGDNNIFPIAFAIVEQESAEAWNFFLTNLREHVVREDGVCIISDRGTGIKAAINREGSRWKPPHAYHAYCVRHIGKNSMEQFKNTYFRSEIVSMGTSLIFDYIFLFYLYISTLTILLTNRIYTNTARF